MNIKQRAILFIFLCSAVLIIIMDNIFPGDPRVNMVKFSVVAAIFLCSAAVGKRKGVQAVLTVSLFFVMSGDFFINLCSVIPVLASRVAAPGVLCFLAAYLLVMYVAVTGVRLGRKERLAALPVIFFFAANFAFLYPYTGGRALPGTFFFGLAVSLMAWLSVCTVYGGRYRPVFSLRLALAGLLVLISDTAVAHSLFNPAFAGNFVPWLKNIIWGTYIPAWTLVAVNVSEDRI